MATDDRQDESLGTVLLALAANGGVAVLKLAAGLLTGSGAMLSEAAHSFGDTSTEGLLLTALHRSDKPADGRHPFGYGKERYFWSLLAAIATFTSGAVFSIWEGVRTVVDGSTLDHVWVSYVVLVGAFVLEGSSLLKGVRQASDEAHRQRRDLRAYLRNPDDPTVKSVVLEDSAALVGLGLAGGGVALHQLTGDAAWDGAASILIGLLLVVTSFALAQTCKSLLVGQQADRQLLHAVRTRLEEQPEVDSVVDMLTMLVGTGSVLLCARIDLVDDLRSSEVEEATLRIDALLREEFTDLREVFLEARPRHDRGTQEAVQERYGFTLSET